MKEIRALDVSSLPGFAFGHRNLLWWGTVGVMAVEGSMFVMLLAIYVYLRGRVPDWPPNLPPPDLRFGVANTIVLLVSAVPNLWYKRAAERLELRKVQIGLVVSIAFAVAFLVIRYFEFTTLNVSWDTNAYGSAVWALMAFHTTHLVTDFLDTVVLTALMFTDMIEGKRFVDVSENAFYWIFVVIMWLPIFVVVYLVPRWW